MSLLSIQIIVAVISILFVPLCMYCCKRMAFAALEENLEQRRRREEDPEENVDDHSEKVMKHVIVKVRICVSLFLMKFEEWKLTYTFILMKGGQNGRIGAESGYRDK